MITQAFNDKGVLDIFGLDRFRTARFEQALVGAPQPKAVSDLLADCDVRKRIVRHITAGFYYPSNGLGF